jgi:hypothetical protein
MPAHQLAAVADATGWVLTAEDMAAIDHILAATIKDPVGVEFMVPPHRKG